jgi:hypothetical protein
MWRAEPPQRPRSRPAAGSARSNAVAYSGQRHAWASEGERAVPVDVRLDRVLIDTPDFVAFVAAAHVYPSGFCFTLSSQLRPTASAEARDVLGQAFFHSLRERIPAEQAERSLRLGVRFADGRGAAINPNLRWLPQTAAQQDALPLMHVGQMSSDAGMADCEVWVVGLPTEGNVELFYRWLDLDVPEASIELDGDALRSASARAVVLWDVPGDASTGETPNQSRSQASG